MRGRQTKWVLGGVNRRQPDKVPWAEKEHRSLMVTWPRRPRHLDLAHTSSQSNGAGAKLASALTFCFSHLTLRPMAAWDKNSFMVRQSASSTA